MNKNYSSEQQQTNMTNRVKSWKAQGSYKSFKTGKPMLLVRHQSGATVLEPLNKPQEGKQYALTGKKGDKCIMNGNTWAESEVPEVIHKSEVQSGADEEISDDVFYDK